MRVIPATTSTPVHRSLFVATILTGSFLLFLVQPMVARMALPRLGGAPNVWNSAQLVYHMRESRPERLADVVGGNLEVRAGSSHIGMLYRALESLPRLSWSENRSSDSEALIRRVAEGRIDYAIVNSNEFQVLRNYYPEVLVAFDIETEGRLAWALPRGADDLREAVDEGRATGTQRLHLGADEDHAGLEGLLDEVVVARLLVLRDHLAPGLFHHAHILSAEHVSG